MTVEANLLSDVVSDLRRLADILQDLAETMAGNAPGKDTQPELSQPEPAIKLEQVRAVLAEKSWAGKRLEVLALLKKYGASKLSAIAPERFPELLREAEAL